MNRGSCTTMSILLLRLVLRQNHNVVSRHKIKLTLTKIDSVLQTPFASTQYYKVSRMLDFYVGSIHPDITNEELETTFRHVFGNGVKLDARSEAKCANGVLQFCFFKFNTEADFQKAMLVLAEKSEPLVVAGHMLQVRPRESIEERNKRQSMSPRKLRSNAAQHETIRSQTRYAQLKGHGMQPIRRSSADSHVPFLRGTLDAWCLYSSVVLIVSGLPMHSMGPKELFGLFKDYAPVAAFVYPELNLQRLRYGEIQFKSKELAQRALMFGQKTQIGHQRLWQVHSNSCSMRVNLSSCHYRPIRLITAEEVTKA